MPNNVMITCFLDNLRHNSKIIALFKTASCHFKMFQHVYKVKLFLALIYLFTQNPFNKMDASTFDITSLKLCHDRYDIRMIFGVDL